MSLCFVTRNKNKVREFEEILGIKLEQKDINLPEIQSINVNVVVKHKTLLAYEQVRKPVITEDTGLTFDTWNGLPGALINWFLNSIGNEGLCKMLKGYDNRAAKGEVIIGYYDGKEYQEFRGSIKGTIAPEPKGEYGFGWDAIFIPAGSSQTFAEMSSLEKNKISMRRIALNKLKKKVDGF